MALELERCEVVAGQVPLPTMPAEGVLFHVDAVVPAEASADLSSDRRRTARQRQLAADGWHPLTRERSRSDLGTCGGCGHRVLQRRGDRSFPKCALGPVSHGAATDVRAWWPACARFLRSWT